MGVWYTDANRWSIFFLLSKIRNTLHMNETSSQRYYINKTRDRYLNERSRTLWSHWNTYRVLLESIYKFMRITRSKIYSRRIGARMEHVTFPIIIFTFWKWLFSRERERAEFPSTTMRQCWTVFPRSMCLFIPAHSARIMEIRARAETQKRLARAFFFISNSLLFRNAAPTVRKIARAIDQ